MIRRLHNRTDLQLPGFLLLEVVVAVGLLVMGMAVIGAQLQSATDRTYQTNHMARVVFLAESKLAEMDTGLLELELEQEDEFGRLFPFYGWRLLAQPLPEDPNPTSPRHPLDTPMVAVTLQILYDPEREVEPDNMGEFNFDEAFVLKTYHTLRTLPRPLDLTTDFGLDEERAADINEQLSTVGGGAVDVNQLNPAMFRDMSMEELLEVLPVLMPALGVGEDSILNMVPAEIRPLLEAIFAEQRNDADGDSGSDDGNTGGTDDTGVDDSNTGSDDGVGDGSGDDGAVDDGSGTPDDDSGVDGDGVEDDESQRGGRNPRGGGRRGGRRGGR
ncbi:MAG: hypothetical protein DHS20C16_27170 [Phycisphaerae bacterium]|nr:MAG: hypothetical protein DHS20C16_27170 [Phycisphaerae bacterium]